MVLKHTDPGSPLVHIYPLINGRISEVSHRSLVAKAWEGSYTTCAHPQVAKQLVSSLICWSAICSSGFLATFFWKSLTMGVPSRFLPYFSALLRSVVSMSG